MSTEAFAEGTAARHSQNSRDPFHAGGRFRGFHHSQLCYGLSGCSAPCSDLTGFPGHGAFYIQAFNGEVALPAVGYDYSIDWTPMLVGLSPTRMAASLAARSSPYRPPSLWCVPADAGRATSAGHDRASAAARSVVVPAPADIGVLTGGVDQLIRMSTGTTPARLSSTVRNHLNAVRKLLE